MSVEMVAIRPLKYRTRRLLPGDNFRVKSDSEAKVLVHLKRAQRSDNSDRDIALDDARAKVDLPPLSKMGEDIASLRKLYQEKTGRRVFNGWTVAELKAKIAAI